MTRPRPRRNPLAYRSDIEALEGRRMLAASIVEAPLDAVRGILVNTTLDEPAADPGSQDPTTADGKISLRSAIQAANATGGLVGIDLPAGIYILTIPPTGADDAASGDLNITTGLLNISGAGAATTIIDAGGIDRALTVQAGTGRLGISGVTIANGSAPMVNGLATGGGAVRLDSGSLTLTSCDIIDSTSTGPGGGAGAGIYVAPAAQLTLDTCLVSNNVASGPGGTATGGGLFVAGGGRATLVNDNINGNAAAGSGASNSDGEGGGLYNDGGQVALTGTSIGENKASADADGVVSRGGGIFETGGGTLTLTNSTLDGNSAQGAVPTDGEAGGDLYNDGDVVTLTNSTVSLGSVSFSPDAPQEETASLAPAIAPSGGVGASLGAGIFNSGVLALTNTIISDNLASYYLGGQGAGGGIYNTGQVSWDGGTADGNFAVSGAGIANIGGTMTLAGVTISGNSADFALVQGPEDHHGIGIDNEGVLTLTKSTVRDNHAVSNMNAVGANGGTSTGGGIYNSGQATLDDDTISGNSANRGGGLAVDGGRLDMLDSTISDNAGGIGGGLYFGPPDIIPIPAPAGALDGAGITGSTITGSTIAFNSSDGTSGNDLVFSDVPLPLTLENTILAGNVGDQNYSTLGGFNSIVSAGHNLNSDASSAFEFRAPGDLSNVDPKLGPLQDNGGPTFTRAPLPGSPAIDAGDPANAPATDQRGQPRIQGNGIDIGAVESSGTAATPPMISVFPSITAAPSPATVGQAVIYVVTATNNSDAPATGVVLNFDLPAGATSVPSLGSPTPVGRRLTFSLGTLPARGSASETIVVTPSAPGTLFVDAFATATNQTVVDDPLPFATVVNAATTTTQAADLAVALAPPTGPIVVGVSTRFTVTVTNTGPSPATGVTLSVFVPEGSSLSSAEGGTLTKYFLNFSLGNLAAGASRTVTINLIAAESGPDVLSSTARVDQADPASANNTATVPITVIPASGADGPTVVGVRRYGYRAQPTSLYLTFSGPLATVTATDPDNYHVFRAGRHGAAVGRGVAASSATYDPTEHAVTLHFARRLDVHRRYVLFVNGLADGGLTDPAGNSLGSHGGSPGSDFTAVIDRSSLAGPASALPVGQATAKVGPGASAVDALFSTGAFPHRAKR